MSYQLSPTEITYLASQFPSANPLSPFVNNKKEPDGSEEASLKEKGVLDEKGHLTDEASALLSPLATPERCARVIIQKPFCLLEKYTYLSNGKLTLAESDGNGLVITPLEGDGQQIMDVLHDFLPHSTIKNADFSLTLQPKDALALLGAIDLCRLRVLSAVSSGEEVSLSFTPAEVAEVLASPAFANGLARGLASNCGMELPDLRGDENFLDPLTEQGCIVKTNDDRLALAPDYRLFATSFMIYDSLILLEAFQLAEENKVAASMDLVFVSGMHDMVSFSAGPGGFEMTSISGADLRARVKATFDCPSFDI